MRNQHLARTNPTIEKEIENKLGICKTRLSKFGDSRDTSQAQFVYTNRIATAYAMKVRSGLDGYYNNLSNEAIFIRRHIIILLEGFGSSLQLKGTLKPFRTSEDDCNTIKGKTRHEWTNTFLKDETYAWIGKMVESYRASTDSRRTNPEIEGRLWQAQITHWGIVAHDILVSIQKKVEELNKAIFAEVCPNPLICEKLMSWLGEDYLKSNNDSKAELCQILHDEKQTKLISLQTSKSTLKHQFRQNRLQKIADKTTHGLEKELFSHGDPIEPGLIQSILYENAELAGILDLHDSLKAYYHIAIGRFLDNFAIQVVERHLLGPKGPFRIFDSDYVSKKLYGETELLKSLVGDRTQNVRERHELVNEIKSLEDSLVEVQKFRALNFEH